MANQKHDSKTQRNQPKQPKPRPWDKVADVLYPLLRILYWAVVISLVLLICYSLRDILVPLVLAGIVAYMFNPVVQWLEQKRIPRGVSIALAIALVVAALLIVAVLVAATSGDDARRVAGGVTRFKENLASKGGQDGTKTLLQKWFGEDSEFARRTTELVRSNVSQLASWSANLGKLVGTKLWEAITGISRGGVLFVAAVAKALLFAIVAFYLLKDSEHLRRSALRLVPPARRNRVTVVLGRIDEHLRGFFRGQMMVCLALMVVYAVGLSVLNVPFALLIAFVGGLANIVPYLGLVLGVLPAVVLSLVAFGDILHPLGAVGVFVAGQMLEGTVLTPRIVGRSANLHPVVVILSILLFSRILGFVGLLLAVPTAAVLKVLAGEALHEYKRSETYQSGSRRRSSSRRRSGGGRRRRRPRNGANKLSSQNKPSR